MPPTDLIHALRLAAICAFLIAGIPLHAQENPQAGPESADRESRQVEQVIKIAFRLEGEVGMVRGTIESWGSDGLKGSFGGHDWDELDDSSLRRIYQRLMDRRSSTDWVLLGELQLRRDGPVAERNAGMAFKRALQLEPTVAPEVEEDWQRVALYKEERAELERIRAAEQLREGLPEGVNWTATPWPTLTDEEQDAAIAEMERHSRELLHRAGFPDAQPIHSEYFLVYSDLNPAMTARITRDLDLMYAQLAKLLGLPGAGGKPLNLFWGKASIIICQDEDQFRLIEAQAFNQMTPPGVVGLCHCIGPKVFVNTFHDPDADKFASVLIHETVHGIMHRFITPARLPTWANEGFAEWVANQAVPGHVDASRRPQGLDFVRRGGNLAEVMAMSYQAGTWPGPNAVGYAVGYILVDLLIEKNPREFADWVRSIKAGEPWRQAFEKQFGVPADALAVRARQWFMTND